ncbi:hypothetical protein [Ramlibacter sp. WS9]|uniref:hypothetical protein n=1 Tax=Ramlibacter sp. WS9 TaxID=1882741 RepID=UPI00114329FF|nr:hypothetical protein [Ramlibacter sp. WS9]
MTLAPAAPTAPAAAQVQALKSSASAAIRESGPGLGVAMRAVPQEPIRLHAEWSEEGVRLWLAMDSALPETLQGIAAQLQRWLSAQGVRLLSISCNGQRISDGRAATAVDMIETEPYPHESTPTQSNRFNLREIP